MSFESESQFGEPTSKRASDVRDDGLTVGEGTRDLGGFFDGVGTDGLLDEHLRSLRQKGARMEERRYISASFSIFARTGVTPHKFY